MILPNPEPGLVLRYSYLWHDAHKMGVEEGRKDRPAVVVITLKKDDDAFKIAVVPITHSRPKNPKDALILPIAVKKRLGLDDEASWIVLTEVNVFNWPGVDLRRVPRKTPKSAAYGYLPAKLTRLVLDNLREKRGLKIIGRSE